MSKISLFAIIAALSLAGCAAGTSMTSAEAEPQDPRLTAAATGEAVNCVSLNRIERTTGLDDRHILFEMSGNTVYRNKLPSSCPGARRDEAFRYSTSTGRICSGEILTFFDPPSNFISGSCALGEFTPIEG